jgi:hypothetical protein
MRDCAGQAARSRAGGSGRPAHTAQATLLREKQSWSAVAGLHETCWPFQPTGTFITEQQRRRDTVIQAALQPMAPCVRSEFSIK